MLILSRKKRERINIFHKGEQLTLIIYDINDKFQNVKLGFISENDKEFIILRAESKTPIIKPTSVFSSQNIIS